MTTLALGQVTDWSAYGYGPSYTIPPGAEPPAPTAAGLTNWLLLAGLVALVVWNVSARR